MGLIERSNQRVKIKLTDFDGPIDLLLHLIRESKLDIKIVKLGEMTKQYLVYLAELGTLDMDLASEFVEVGATLIEIKGRQILPRPEIADESETDIEEELRQRIEEYKLFKDAGDKLKILEDVNRFYREPAVIRTKTEWNLDGVVTEDLIDAFVKMIGRVGERAVRIEKTRVVLDRFTVADKIKDIVMRLKNESILRFSGLFEADMTRGEVINTFLAVLELLKNQIITAKQSGKFADIEIEKGESYNGKTDNVGSSEFDRQETPDSPDAS